MGKPPLHLTSPTGGDSPTLVGKEWRWPALCSAQGRGRGKGLRQPTYL